MEDSVQILCRLCLKHSLETTNLFSYHDGHLLADLVKIICPISIVKNEPGIPDNVCKGCLELIIDAINLRDLSLMNDAELRRTKEEINFKEENFYIEALDEATFEDAKFYPINLDEQPIKIESYKEQTVINISKVKNYCELCDTIFSNASSFKRHQLRRHSDAQYHCDLCGTVFKTKHDTETHMKRVHVKKFQEVKFLYSQKLSIDVTDMYEKLEEAPRLNCTFCAYTDDDEDSLLQHLSTHLDVVKSGKMYCTLCPSAILSMDFMIKHTKSHNEKLKTHRCLICNKLFPFDDKFLNHLRNHKKNQHQICFCPECGRKFSKPRLMEDHIRFIHNKEALFCCPKCGQGFGSKSALNGHIKRHIDGNKYQCPFCPKTFSSHNLLNSHKVVHTTERPFACGKCDKRFKNQKVLNDHLKRHDNSRPLYICSICNRSLNSSFALSRHFLIHTGSKPYECEHCPKAYAQKNDLNKHLRIHVGENTYFCDFPGCTESFRIVAELRVHQGVHYLKS